MTTHSSWREVTKDLRERTRRLTPEQKRLASFAGIKLPNNLPRAVAAVRLKRALGLELDFAEVTPPTDWQWEYLSSLNVKIEQNSRIRNDREEAGAWITHYLLTRRLKALQQLKLEAGDIVEITDSSGERFAEVVSLSNLGRVYFRGGQGARAWPDRLSIACRASDTSPTAKKLKRAAANQAAVRAKIADFSLAKERELAEFKVLNRLTEEDVDRFQEVVDAAQDEKPVQQFIEAHPQILAALLTGHSRFLVPRPQFGGKRIPDFLLGDVDSLGIRWILVELETTISSVTLKNENSLDKYARKGTSQIEEWRNWILRNLDLARRSRREDGLGLVDIRPQSEGLVLVGRRARLLSNTDVVRHPIRENQGIRVHTYDWLIDRLRGTLEYSGPSGVNPNLLQRADNNEDWVG